MTICFYFQPCNRVTAEYEEPTGQSAKLARTFVYGNGIDEVLAMYLPERDYDPNDIIRLMDFCDTWLADSGDGNYNSNYDYDDSGIVDFNDFAVLADDNWSLPQQANETRFYYLHDALGSVVGLVGARFKRPQNREFYLYDVYGATSDLSAAQNPYLFTGRRLDILANGSLKIYNYRARTYNPATGRFLQTDPIGYADSMNLYEYVTGNPTNYVDPWGLKSLYEDQFSMWDRWRYEAGSVGGVFGLSLEQADRMDKYWQQYQRANELNQHPKEVAEFCKAAKQIASGCAKSAHMDVCRFIKFVDENGWGAVHDRIIHRTAEPFANRIMMCYEYGSGDFDQAYKDACNWRMIAADLVGLTDLCYGVDYLKGQDSIDINTGSAFRGEEQYVKGLQGLSKFCGTVAAASKLTMACGEAAAATGASTSPKGGTYKLTDPETGKVMRTGRTKDLDRRMREHLRNPQTKDLRFEVDKRTNLYFQQRGREQILHDQYKPPMNKYRPISPRNPNLEKYLKSAKTLGE